MSVKGKILKKGAKFAKKKGAKVAAKAGAKVGAKVAAKVGARAIPYAGQVMMAVDVAPVLIDATKTEVREQWHAAKDVYGHAKKKEFGKAGLRARDYVLDSMGRQVQTAGRVVTAAVGLSNPVRYVRTNPIELIETENEFDVVTSVEDLLSTMLALRTAYQYAHWNTRSYANHLLFERVYQSLDEDIDTLAELGVQSLGHAVQPYMLLPETTQGWIEDPMQGELRIIYVATDLLGKLRRQNILDVNAFENFLQGLIQNRRRAQYLISMR